MEPILNFLARHIDDSRFGGMAAEVADVLIGKSRATYVRACPNLVVSREIDMYSSVLGQSPLIDDIISKMQKKVHFELQFQKQLLGLNGALEMVLAQVCGCDQFITTLLTLNDCIGCSGANGMSYPSCFLGLTVISFQALYSVDEVSA